MTRDEHRAEALALYDLTDAFRPAHPHRLALLAEAQLHATLAITAPETTGLKIPAPSGEGPGETVPPLPMKPATPRKRTAAKKVAESKETTK